MKNKLLYIFLIIFFLKGLAWILVVPIFQSPDEPVHFGYVQRLGELGGRGDPRFNGIISKELTKVGKTVNFSMAIEHPVWRGYQNDWKQTISRIYIKDRSDFTVGGWPIGKFDSKKEEIIDYRGKKNPPLYYWLAAVFYKCASSFNFLVRFYAVRFFSLLLSLLTAFISYLVGLEIFKNRKMSIALACNVCFQPMFSFLSATVNSANLAILFSTLFIFVGIKALKTKKFYYQLLLILIILAGLYVKQQMLLLFLPLPFFFPIFFIPLLMLLAGLLIIPADFFGLNFRWREYKEVFGFTKNISFSNAGSLANNYFSASASTFKNNLFPWYWGVFGWLESTMPIFVYRVLKVICLVSLAGLVVYFKKIFHQIEKRKILLFLFMTSLFFSAGIIFNDFKVYSGTGEVFGLQGRYFLPLITAHMAMIILGLKALVPKKLISVFPWVLISGSFILNIIGFITAYSYFWGSL